MPGNFDYTGTGAIKTENMLFLSLKHGHQTKLGNPPRMGMTRDFSLAYHPRQKVSNERCILPVSAPEEASALVFPRGILVH